MEKAWRSLLILVLFACLTLLLNVNYLYFHYSTETQLSPRRYRIQDAKDHYALGYNSSAQIKEPTDSRIADENNRSLGTYDVPASTMNPITIKTEKSLPHSDSEVGYTKYAVNNGAVIILSKKELAIASSLQTFHSTPRSIGAGLTLPTPVQSSTARGYVLAGDFWEQQTSGSRNLQNLQCWAGKLGISVVEPFMHNSVLKTSIHSQNGMRFGDLFSLESWNRYSMKQQHAILVPWEDFLQGAPKNVIVANLKYEYLPAVKKNRQLVKQDPSKFPPLSEMYKTGCSKGWPDTRMYKQLKMAKFKVVRNVCFNFEYGNKLTTDEFNHDLYGSYSPNDVIVIFRQWRGTGPPARVLVTDSGCHNTFIQEHVGPSPRLVRVAEIYTQKYLKGGKYIAIMARLEKTKIAIPRKGIIPFCFQQIIKYWNETKIETGIETTFLSIDIGKYGSNSFRNTGDETNLLEEFKKFTRQLYGESFSIPNWENSFEDVSHMTDAGYIALLQKVLVTGASCVIFVGGGTFQRHALRLYQMLHANEEPCIKIITECTTHINLSL